MGCQVLAPAEARKKKLGLNYKLGLNASLAICGWLVIVSQTILHDV